MTTSLRKKVTAVLTSVLTGAAIMALSFARPEPAKAIPAFARKYGLPCSACHEAWPKLSEFGLTFRDNGYQLGNERDSPIWQNPSYIPISLRMTPNWHREHTNEIGIDSVPGDPTSPTVANSISTSGFDLSGMDFWSAGTLYNNISFVLLPSSDENAQFHFESAFIRFDNLFHSRWANLKFGKFELDGPEFLSEKRILWLSNNGGYYVGYHFEPLGDSNLFGYGDNQLGMEVAGHSRNSMTRYSVSVLSDNDGTPGLPTGNQYDAYFHFSQAFMAPKLGQQRMGAFLYDGHSATYYMTSGGVPIPGSGQGNAPFYRFGAYGTFYFKHLDITPLYMYGWDSAYLGTSTPSNLPLPPGSNAPSWNDFITEVHYTFNPQLIAIGKYEFVRMNQQAYPLGTVVPLPGGGSTVITSSTGNTDAWAIGYRWYPIMFSRAGVAFQGEYANVKTVGEAPITNKNLVNSSIFFGFDFDF
jgi:hypothetical protein